MVLAELGGKLDAPIKRHPLYLQAKARRDRAALDLAHTAAYAPVAGVLSAVALETGEYVEAGDLVFALIATGDPWIEVNLKEVHLTHIEVGQKATAVVDAYPDEVFDATVDSISPATGAVFSLLPPQNATGNWVKVVQRVPVRLKLDARHDTARLRAGMTVTVSIDTERERDIRAMIKNALADVLDAL
jgi:membrane fusion protein (multidrug efflux system)